MPVKSDFVVLWNVLSCTILYYFLFELRLIMILLKQRW